MKPVDEAGLVAAAQAGEAWAPRELLRGHQVEVRGFLRRLCRDASLAEDLAQETFLTALGRIGEFRGESSLRVWLCGIAWRKAMTGQRGDRRRRLRETAQAQGAATMDDPRGRSEARADVWAALHALPAPERAAAALCLASDLTHVEAAQALNLPLGTLKSHVARARKALAQALEAYHDGR